MRAFTLNHTITPQLETRLYYGILLLIPFAMALKGPSWLFISPWGIDVWVAQGAIQEWANPEMYNGFYKTGRSIYFSFLWVLYKIFGPVYGQAAGTLICVSTLALCTHGFLRMFVSPMAAFLSCVALLFFTPIHGFFGGGITYQSLPASAICAVALWLTALAMRKQGRTWLVLSGFAWGVLLCTEQAHLFFMPVAFGLVYFLHRHYKVSLPIWQVFVLGSVGALLSVILTGLLSVVVGRNFFDFLNIIRTVIGVGRSFCDTKAPAGIWLFTQSNVYILRNVMFILFGIAVFFVVSQLRQKHKPDIIPLFFSVQYLYIFLVFVIYGTYDYYYGACFFAQQPWQTQFIYLPCILMLAPILQKITQASGTQATSATLFVSVSVLVVVAVAFYRGDSKQLYQLLVLILLLVVLLSTRYDLKKYFPLLIATVFIGYFVYKTTYVREYGSVRNYQISLLVNQTTLDLKKRIISLLGQGKAVDSVSGRYNAYTWYPLHQEAGAGQFTFKDGKHGLSQYLFGRMTTISAVFNGTVLRDLYQGDGETYDIPSTKRLREVIKRKGVVVLLTSDNTYVTHFKNAFTQLGYPPKIEVREYGQELLEEPAQAHILRFSYQ